MGNGPSILFGQPAGSRGASKCPPSGCEVRFVKYVTEVYRIINILPAAENETYSKAMWSKSYPSNEITHHAQLDVGSGILLW